MAIVYIQPGTGTGSGTLEDPYYFDELSAAHTLAGEQGKVIFLDGEYILVNNNTTFKGSTYEAKNRGKAIIKSSSISYLKYIYVGDTSDNYAVSKFKGLSFEDVGSPAWNNRAVNIGSAVDQYHEFESCTFKLYASDYGFLGPGTGSDAPAFSAKFTGCIFDLIRYGEGANDGTAPYFYSASALPNGFELKNCVLKFSSHTDSSLTIVFNDNSGNQEAHIQDTIIFADPGERVNLGTVPGIFTEKNVVYNNISGASTDPAKNVFVDLDPKFIDATNNDYRLRPNSPLIGGIKIPDAITGVFLQPGTGTGAGTFDDPYFVDQLNEAETAVGEGGVLYLTDGSYDIGDSTFLEVVEKLNIEGLNRNKVTITDINVTHTNMLTDTGTLINPVPNIRRISFKNINFDFNMATAGSPLRGLRSVKRVLLMDFESCIFSQRAVFNLAEDGESTFKGCIFTAGATFEQVQHSKDLSNATLESCTFYYPESFANLPWYNILISYSINGNVPPKFKNCIFYSESLIPEYTWTGSTDNPTGKFLDNSDDNSNWAYNFENYQHPNSKIIGDTNPLFIDPANNDFRLRPHSPLIGGSSGGSSEEKWIQHATTNNKTYAFFDPAATGTGDGSSLANACTDIYEAAGAVDFGGYIFVADMDYTFPAGITLTKPVKIQALNPGKAIWRTLNANSTFYIYPTGYQFAINVSSATDSDTFSGTKSGSYTRDIDGYYTGISFATNSSVTGDEVYTITNHSFDGTNHTFTLDRAISGTLSGNISFYEEISSNEDTAIRDMVLVDFNTPVSANGNGVAMQIYSKNSTTAASTACGSMIFERNSILQTYNITGNNKTGFYIRNDYYAVVPTRYIFIGNTISLKNYPGFGNRVYPHNLGPSYLSVSDAEKRFCSNNSYYFYSNLDSNPDFGGSWAVGSNSVWVIESEYGYTSSSHNGDTLSEGNYAYGVNNANLSANPFVNAIDGDFRLRPNSELIGKT